MVSEIPVQAWWVELLGAAVVQHGRSTWSRTTDLLIGQQKRETREMLALPQALPWDSPVLVYEDWLQRVVRPKEERQGDLSLHGVGLTGGD